MTAAREIINRLSARGITLQPEGADGLLVIGISKLTDQEKAILKAHKPTLLEALRQSAEAVNRDTAVKHGRYAPNCNRCRRYRWRSATCQRQGRVEFANTPPCQGRYYQPFALTLAEREAMAGTTGEDMS
jgi:hypothetical protein